ncbi:hypothetical protein F0562_030269 [Nyssa sinensis]|uniref:Uncharacterized protein n=1 Tax=Nyssa sinensis TaxID=561372 RepID=A0A5J5AZI5_9ASTE|nr:hypothetical protein F0562_030269 [Nyssa sinensis]
MHNLSSANGGRENEALGIASELRQSPEQLLQGTSAIGFVGRRRRQIASGSLLGSPPRQRQEQRQRQRQGQRQRQQQNGLLQYFSKFNIFLKFPSKWFNLPPTRDKSLRGKEFA